MATNIQPAQPIRPFPFVSLSSNALLQPTVCETVPYCIQDGTLKPLYIHTTFSRTNPHHSGWPDQTRWPDFRIGSQSTSVTSLRAPLSPKSDDQVAGIAMSIIFIAVKTWVPQFLNLASLLRHFALKQGSDCYLAGCLLSSSADDPRINKSKLNFQSEKIYIGPLWSVLNSGTTKMYFLQWFCWTSFVCYVLALLFNSDLAGSDSRTCDDYPMTFPYLIGSNTNRLMFLSLIVSNNINLLVITLVRVIFY